MGSSYDSKGFNAPREDERHGQTEGFLPGEKSKKTLTETAKSTNSSKRTAPRVTVHHIDKEDSFRKSIKYTLLLMTSKRMLILLP